MQVDFFARVYFSLSCVISLTVALRSSVLDCLGFTIVNLIVCVFWLLFDYFNLSFLLCDVVLLRVLSTKTFCQTVTLGQLAINACQTVSVACV